ncbi:aspartate-semialdehyde dehydrogenase [Parachitinimonas caeni]|uniref:Aspartate-semialdehyde dehydrogenase n=1 Tax=Parachitinimonas caeni TaxID=3031301 RepID=A0ABT7E471_9NEIS|nr:aspartate-semialdehyde dehydrogenase [Parachitinimonas caeni]MDK2126849.1 aspartate-semialdehyde dehydrogenase [Parachitinimonas caeni]
MQYRIAVGGATGNVGSEMLKILAQRGFPAQSVVALASARSAGKQVAFGNTSLTVQDLATFDFASVDLAFLSTGGDNSRQISPRIAATGCVVIDNSSAFRLDPEVPLVVPEVNAPALAGWNNRRILPVGNCSIIQLVVALKPLHDAVGIKRVVVSTYQSVSGGGKRLVEQLAEEIASAELSGSQVRWPAPSTQAPFAFNVVPYIGSFMEDGSTSEEWKMTEETRKMLDPAIRLTATCVRVPVMVGHSVAVNVELASPLTVAAARELFEHAPGIVVQDSPQPGGYATPWQIAGTDAVYVSRLRRDPTIEAGLAFWVVADNIRKGAALNAVQIAEALIARPDFQQHAMQRQQTR